MPFLRGSEDSLNWAASQASKLPVDVLKNSITGASANDGEFDTSTTTAAPLRTSASPSPVSVLTPEEGEAATASWPCARRIVTTFDPINPLPPITTIFIFALSFFLSTLTPTLTLTPSQSLVASLPLDTPESFRRLRKFFLLK